MRRALAFPLVLFLLLTACEDSGPSPILGPDDLDAPTFTVQDITTFGNPYFFWLTPLADSDPETDGVPALDWSPAVVMTCVQGTSASPCEGDGNTFEADQVDQHYQYNWDPQTESGAQRGQTWRIEAHLGGQVLGFVDFLIRNSRTLPVKFRIEEGAVAFAVEDACDAENDNVLNCTVQEGDPNTETAVEVFDGDHLAGLLNVPPQGSGFGNYIVVLKLLNALTVQPSLPNPPQRYFLGVQVLDQNGNALTLNNAADLAVCLEEVVPFSLLRIFRVDEDGNTEIESDRRLAPECGTPQQASLFKGRLSPLNRVAGFLRTQPLGASHGGLTTSRTIFSEFGLVLVDENPDAFIASPDEDEMVAASPLQLLAFDATAPNNTVRWAVRHAGNNPSCERGSNNVNNVVGNVDGMSDAEIDPTWENGVFSASVDITDGDRFPAGPYCFAFNTQQGAATGNRLVQFFTIDLGYDDQ